MQVQKRVYWADFLRIIAIYAVIIQHICPAIFLDQTQLSTVNWNIANIYDCLANWSVPVFIMISGMFFLDPEKKFTIPHFFKKNVLKILIIILFWGIFYNLIKYALSIEKPTTLLSVFIPLFYKRLPWYHLWFLYLILALYLITPILRVYTVNAPKRNLEYLLFLFLLVSCIRLFNQYNSPSHFPVAEFSIYSSYFIAGYYFHRFELSKKVTRIIYIAGILSMLVKILLTQKVSIFEGHKVDVFDYLSPLTIIIAYSVFLFFKNHIHFESQKINRAITYVASCVLGVYLLHALFIQIFSEFEITALSFYPPISILILSLITFILSFLVTVFLRKIPLIGKYIV